MWKVLTCFKFNPAGLPRNRKVHVCLWEVRLICSCWSIPFRCMRLMWDCCLEGREAIMGMLDIPLSREVGLLFFLKKRKFLPKMRELRSVLPTSVYGGNSSMARAIMCLCSNF